MSPRRRVRDKWRSKVWYTVVSPPYFGGVELATIPADDPSKLIGRVIESTLYDLTSDFAHQYMKIYFKVIDVDGKKVSTIFKGHEYSRDYLRSLVRRRTTRVDGIFNVTTKDGYRYRIRVGVFTTKRITNSRKKAIRRYVFKVLDEWAKKTDNETFIKDMLFGNIDEEIKKVSRKVYPIREGTGIMKVKLIAIPEKKEVLEKA